MARKKERTINSTEKHLLSPRDSPKKVNNPRKSGNRKYNILTVLFFRWNDTNNKQGVHYINHELLRNFLCIHKFVTARTEYLT